MSNKEDFDVLLKKIQSITEDLSDPNISLEKAIELYEEGAKLSIDCKEKLNSFSTRIQKIKNTLNEEFQTEGAFK